ncbi:MAG: VCBS repeat-containing protein [Acidobacteriales bacterium]|nr:VCBS repeat-containing protein [Terriglobales bacterium]
MQLRTPSNSASLLLGNGDGTFKAHTDYTVGTQPYAVVAYDYNRDSRLDHQVWDNCGDR